MYDACTNQIIPQYSRKCYVVCLLVDLWDLTEPVNVIYLNITAIMLRK